MDLPSLIQANWGIAAPHGDYQQSALDFIKARYALNEATRQSDLNERTRQTINQQQGYGDVNPFALQEFDTQKQQNQISLGDYNNRQETYMNSVDFANNFLNNVRNDGTTKPVYLNNILGAGSSPVAADAAMSFLAGQNEYNNKYNFAKQSEQLQQQGFLAREKLSDANALERQRLANENALNMDEKSFQRKRQLENDAKLFDSQELQKGIENFYKTGDLGTLLSLPIDGGRMNLLQEDFQAKAAQKKLEEEKISKANDVKNAISGLTGQAYTPEQRKELALAKISKELGDKGDNVQYELAKRAVGDPSAYNIIQRYLGGNTQKNQDNYLQMGRDAYGSNFETLVDQVRQRYQKQKQTENFLRELDKLHGLKAQ